MRTIQADVQVSFHYDVFFTTDLFAPDNTLFRDVVTGAMRAGDEHAGKRPSRVLFVMDGAVEKALHLRQAVERYCHVHGEGMRLVCAPLVVPGGEAVKNTDEHVLAVQRAINETGLDRHSYVVAIGGGALLDAVGYAAATAHRGIRLLRVPTTTLSQNDSGVGVKNAINFWGKKNWVGTFAPPWAVLNDFRFLQSLPEREWRGGIAEAVKVALIKDAEFFRFLECCAPDLASRDMAMMKHLVHRCAELHVTHICTSGDAFEMGSSRPLDFGHWAAHKLEQTTNYRLHHGEAVAVGLALDVTYSHLKGWLSQHDWSRVLRTLSDVGFGLYVPELAAHLDDLDHPDSVFRGLREFREHLGGDLTIQMLKGIGHGFNVHEVDEALMIAAIRKLEQATRQLHERELEAAA